MDGIITETYYNNVKVVGEMIRQNTLAHFLFRHAVEPVVLLPLFVRLCAFLGLRKLRSEKKEQTQRALIIQPDSFMLRHTIQRERHATISLDRQGTRWTFFASAFCRVGDLASLLGLATMFRFVTS